MTDNEIIKALECCSRLGELGICYGCPLINVPRCTCILNQNTLNLINRQKAEIERLKEENEKKRLIIESIGDYMFPLPFETDYDKAIKTAKAEAYKEFWELLKLRAKERFDYYNPNGCDLYFSNGMLCGWSAMKEAGDNLVKEMVGENNAE